MVRLAYVLRPPRIRRIRKHVICYVVVLCFIVNKCHGPASTNRSNIPSNFIEAISLNCDPIINNTVDIIKYEYWNFDYQHYEDELYSSKNICETIHNRFYFEKRPLSREEERFPLAFGYLVYKDLLQVLLQFSIFYQPQNAYCICVDDFASKAFKKFIMKLPNCFNNVHTMIGQHSDWGTFGILDNVYQCFKHLTLSKHNWKYYQYLSGSDLPIRTNLEMVRIMKALNGSINTDVEEFDLDRYRTMEGIHPPVPLFKSAMSVAMPRAAANYIVRSTKVRRLLKYLSHTWIPDESFWTSVGGNAALLRVPGAFRARDIIWLRKHMKMDPQWWKTISSVGSSYIARYQVWEFQKQCYGQFKTWSCIFGVLDIPDIITRPELIVHKFSLDIQPAAYMCLLKEIRYRSHNPVEFDAVSYSEMPTVELHNGKRITELTHPEWLLQSSFYK